MLASTAGGDKLGCSAEFRVLTRAYNHYLILGQIWGEVVYCNVTEGLHKQSQVIGVGRGCVSLYEKSKSYIVKVPCQ